MSDILVRKLETKKGSVYQYRFEVAPVGGKRKWVSKSGFKTKKEAKEAAKIAQQAYENSGMTTLPSDMSYSDLIDEWVRSDVEISCTASTVKSYKKTSRLYIKPRLGAYRLRTITKQNIKDFLTDMYDEGFSMTTIAICRSIFSRSFEFAVDNRYIRESPAANIKPIKKNARAPRVQTRTKPHAYMTKDEMRIIFNRFPEGTSCHLGMMLAYHCGLRLGEAYALTWDDIDLKNRTIEINRQIQWKPQKNDKDISGDSLNEKSGYWYFMEPKYSSYRTIDIDDELYELLARELEKRLDREERYAEFYSRYYINEPLLLGGVAPKERQAIAPIRKQGAYEIKFLNVNDDGSCITPRCMHNASQVIHHKLGMKKFDYHSLRHTHATMLMESGAPMVYIQRRLGHKRIDLTSNVYTNHLTDIIKEQGNDIMKSLF